MKKDRIVMVLWLDAHAKHEGLSMQNIKDINKDESEQIAVSIGTIIDENNRQIAISSFFFPDLRSNNLLDLNSRTGYRFTTFIPKSLIKKIVELEPKNKKEKLLFNKK